MARGERGPGRRGRLSRSGDFERAYREGRSSSSRYVVLSAGPRPADAAAGPRLGVSVSRKLGGAVQRNEAKRVLREAFWAIAGRLPSTHDFVIVARPDLRGLVEREGAEGARAELEGLARESRLLEERKT